MNAIAAVVYITGPVIDYDTAVVIVFLHCVDIQEIVKDDINIAPAKTSTVNGIRLK